MRDGAACIISFPDPVCLHTLSVMHATCMQILHLYYLLHKGGSIKGFRYLLCNTAEVD